MRPYMVWVPRTLNSNSWTDKTITSLWNNNDMDLVVNIEKETAKNYVNEEESHLELEKHSWKKKYM